MSTIICNMCTGVLIAGLLAACGSGNDSTLSNNIQEAVDAENTGSITGESEQEPVNNVGESLTETDNLQNDAEQETTETQQELENSLPQGSDNAPPINNNQRVNFGTAKLLVDLDPIGSSYPAKFSLSGDKLFFWTTDRNPNFANCASHWSSLGEEDKKVVFNLVAAHPETGLVAMNKKIMTLGDFAEDPNDACGGDNSSIMNRFEHKWTAQPTASGEQQFVIHFPRDTLGPDRVWTTDGSEPNTFQLASASAAERVIFDGGKVFFVGDDGLSVADSVTGDRRKLFERGGGTNIYIRHLVKSPARKATFEMAVGQNRSQVWSYDLDTDEWTKTFNIKPDDNVYQHFQTMMVNGQTLVSRGRNIGEERTVLSISSGYGTVTSFESLTDTTISFLFTDAPDNNTDELFYSATDYSVSPSTESIWRYHEGRVEEIFTKPGLGNIRVISGYEGRIYITGIREIQRPPEEIYSLELWSYDSLTGQLVKLSNDDWYALHPDHPHLYSSYFFSYQATPEGLLFVNLKEDSGRELWFTDGTPEGTRRLTDINPGVGSSDPEQFYYSEDAIYFSADDGTHGREPWMIPISR